MTVNNIGANVPVQQTAATAPARAAAPAAPATTTRAADHIELSGANPAAASHKATGGFRADKVAAIKAQIANGTYDEDSKLNGAIDNLLNELNK